MKLTLFYSTLQNCILFFFIFIAGDEFSDKPETRKDYNTQSNNDVELELENKERQEYEEEYMTRLVMSKKDKQRRKRALEGRSGGFIVDNLRSNGLTEIEDYSALDRLISQAKDGGYSSDEGESSQWNEKDKRMRKTLQKLEQEQRKGRKSQSGDADVEYRDPADVARRAQDRASAKMRRNGGGDVPEWGEEGPGRNERKNKNLKMDNSDNEDEYYKKSKMKQKGTYTKRR